MKITFLKAADGTPLRKEYGHKNGDRVYPQVASFSSSTIEIESNLEGLREFETQLKEHAEKGYAMLKGEAKHGIKKRSRRGLTEKTTKTQHIVLDIDGLTLEGVRPNRDRNDRAIIEETAERIIKMLPPALHEVSYIVGVSSGYGRKPTINMHFHFLLSQALSPQGIRDWLTSLNFSTDEIQKQLGLTATKKFLKFIVDPVVASNGQLIYITPPLFHKPSKDPVEPDARMFLVEKQEHTIDLAPLIADADPEANRGKIEKRIKELCKQEGIRYKEPKRTNTKSGSVISSYITNPARMRIEYAYTDGNFARFNINGGDSNAYWIALDNPRIMQSFKGDPPFDFKEADPDTYQWVLDNIAIKEDTNKNKTSRSMVVHDVERDTYAKIIYSPSTNRLKEFYFSKKDSLKDWMISNGEEMPDVIEPWRIIFDPTIDTQIDFENNIINRYVPSRHWMHSKDPTTEVQLDDPLEYGYAYQLQRICPVIYDIINHMLGGNPTTFEHFFNWFAYVVKNREKTGTAWLIQGTTGTGKGLFFKRIVHPLFGGNSVEDFALMKRMSDLDDDFNSYLETTLFMVVDEFRMGDSKRMERIENSLKNQITEPIGTIRAMRQNPVQRKLFTNFMFATNNNDALVIASNDRRYNVAERQNIKLTTAFPYIDNPETDKQIRAELPYLCGFIKAFDINESAVRRTLENEAKHDMRQASASTTQMFVGYLERNDLIHFIDIVYERPKSNIENQLYDKIRRMLVEWVADANNRVTRVAKSDLRALFEYVSNREIPRASFNKLMVASNLKEKRMRIGPRNTYGYEINWELDPAERVEALNILLSEVDFERLKKEGVVNLDGVDIRRNTPPTQEFAPPSSGIPLDDDQESEEQTDG